MLKICALLFVVLVGTHHAHAAKRAFVVGIAHYDDPGLVLDNGIRDATRVSDQLSKTFSVTFLKEADAGKTKFLKAWKAFLGKIDPKANDDVVVYLSGHGVGISGANYFVPRDVLTSSVKHDSDPVKAFIPLSYLLDSLKARSPGGAAVWILDACRDNQFKLGNPKGLATGQQTSPGHEILYAAADGEESDGGPPESSGLKGNSLYTQVLLQGMQKFAKQDIGVLASSVQKRVHQINSSQTPVTYGSLSVNWCFAGCDDSLLQLVTLETAEKVASAESTRAFALSKSISHGERRQNAVFLGKQSASRGCVEGETYKHPFGCGLLQDLVDGKGKKYSDAMLIPQISVNIRKRAPIVRNKAAYFCVSGILERETKIETTGILSLKYENDIYYWATVKGKQETCIRGPKDSRDVAAAH